jgi:hypothetical protein
MASNRLPRMSSPNRTRIVAVALLMVLVSTSCGGSADTTEQGGRDIEVCALITAAEAEAWLGGPVDQPAPYDGPDPEPTCVYKSSGAQTQILLQVYDGDVYYSGDNPEIHPDATPIGVGSEGYAEPGSVGFLQNGWSVSITRISGPVTDASLLAAANTVSSRLP